MKRITIMLLVACFCVAGCITDYKTPAKATAAPTKSQRFIGEYKGDISITKASGDNVILQRQQEDGFELQSMDIKTGVIQHKYKIDATNKQMYYKQLTAEKALLVKQLDNSEENNQLIIRSSEDKIIAKRVAYSQEALVAVSPNERFVVYSAVNELQNGYGLYLYDLVHELDILILESVDEALLNDMKSNISWSLDESYILISNKLIFNAQEGAIAGEINAAKAIWSPSGKKICFIKEQNGYGKTLCYYDMLTKKTDELFITNSDEVLSGEAVWNQKETKLAFITIVMNNGSEKLTENSYKALYSLDIASKEAIRIDNALQLEAEELNQLLGLAYNEAGSVIAVAIAHNSSADNHLYNIETGAYELFINMEYLHQEDNESYGCVVNNKFYIVQGNNIIEVDESMNSRIVHHEDNRIDDIFISKDSKSMMIVKRSEDGVLIRQIENFTDNG